MRTLKVLGLIAVVGLLLLAFQVAFPHINVEAGIVTIFRGVWNGLVSVWKAAIGG